MTLALAHALLLLAPASARETLLGDLLEEHATIARPRLGALFAALWLARECARSALPLALWRMRRAGPLRVALMCAAALASAGLAHAAGLAAWHLVLTQVPLRALHDESLAWRAATGCTEAIAALFGAALVIHAGIARKGGRE